MNYYPRHVGDYNNDAGHLSLLEHGVYVRLLDLYYSKESGIPDDQKYRWLRAISDEEKAAVDNVLAEFFCMSEDRVWIQSRCERELAAASIRSETARANGIKGGRPKKTEPEANENPAETDGKPKKTQPVSDGLAKETEGLTNQKPKAKTKEKELLTEFPKDSGEESAQWWALRDEFDPVACEIVELVRSAKFYDDFAPDVDQIQNLLIWARGFSPEDQFILDVVVSFVERAGTKRKREYINVDRTLRAWIQAREDKWRSIKRQREIDASRQHPQTSRPKGGGLEIYRDAFQSAGN